MLCASLCKAGWDELVSTEDLAIGRGDILIVEDMQPLGRMAGAIHRSSARGFGRRRDDVTTPSFCAMTRRRS